MFLFAGVGLDGNPSPGYHLVEDDRTFAVLDRCEVTQPIISCGSSYIVNVAPGFYCKALVNRTPILLGTGQHQVGFSLLRVVQHRAVPACVRAPMSTLWVCGWAGGACRAYHDTFSSSITV